MDNKWEGFRKPNFGAPPQGYVPGLGRGATGFITRSDIGPAKIEAAAKPEVDDADYVESKYDAWSGYSAPLFSKKHMDDEDREAEELYNLIEERMDGRRREQREQRVKQLMKKEAQKKSISQAFSDLKREMAKVSYEDWLNLPQSADSSLKKRKKQKYVPIPDTMLVGFLNEGQPANKEVAVQNINELREAKQILLKSKLDKASQNFKGQTTVVDRTGYLTSLNSLKLNGEEYMGDLKRARLILKSATNTTPQNPQVWMCAARVQELDGKLQQARDVINQGLEHCKTSQDLWIEASRLERPQVSKAVLIKGLTFLPKSEKLWLTSARKETEKQIKIKILKKGLEHNSTSLLLWKQLIELANETEAKELLAKAVECLPQEVDLWLALAKLQTYQVAKSVLNKARKNNPLQIKIWIAAAQLEETQTQNPASILSKIEGILSKANQVLTKNGVIIKRDQWIEEAILCQRKNNLITCQAIIKLTFTLSSEAQLQNIISKKCLELYEFQKCIETIRLLYRYGVKTLNSKMLMEKALAFERLVGSQPQLQKTLYLATQLFGTSQEFWIATADNFLKELKYDQAISILNEGLKSIPDSQGIQLKKVDIYLAQGQMENAENLLEQLRQSPRIQSWIKSIQLYYRQKNYQKAWELCERAYKVQTSQRVIELAFKIQKKLNGYNHAKTILEKAVQKYEKSLTLWTHFVDLEVENGNLAKARTVLEKARVKLPKCEQLYIMSVNLELKANNPKAAQFMLSKGLAELPKSGQLWTIAIEMEPRNTRLKKIAEAENACSDTPQIFVAGAKIFWRQNKIEKAKKWLQKAIILNPLNGDTWGYFYCFIKQFQPDNLQNVLQRLRATTITEGRRWKEVLKQDDSDKLSKEEIFERIVADITKQMSKIQ